MFMRTIAPVASVTALLAAFAGGCASTPSSSPRPASAMPPSEPLGELNVDETARAEFAPFTTGSEPAAPRAMGGGPRPSTVIPWDQRLFDLDVKQGETVTVTCPAGGSLDNLVYGTEVYAEKSSICGAAVHAGKITPKDGGTVTLEVIDGQPRYLGTTQHGVASTSFASEKRSFVFH